MELFPFFHQIFKILKLFVLYFKNYKRQVVSWNCKHVQHVKIYLPCNFEVNPITHFDQLCKLEKRGDEIKKKNLLLRKQWANCNQTFVEWSLDGPLPKLCPVIPTANQDGHQAKNRKKGGWNLKKNLLLWNYWANLNQSLLKWSLGGPLSKLCPSAPSCIQDGCHY